MDPELQGYRWRSVLKGSRSLNSLYKAHELQESLCKSFKAGNLKYEKYLQTPSFLRSSLLTMVSHLPRELYEELGASIRGNIYLRDQPGYARNSFISF